MSDAPRVAVIEDGANRFVRWTDRAEIHAAQLPHRSIHVLVFDSRDRLVLQLRHRDKLTWPLAWDISCSGHVEEPDHDGAPPDADLDAVYRRVAERELGEELGIRGAELELLGEFGPVPGVHYEWLQMFVTRHDGPYVIQDDELEAVRAVTPAQFQAMCDDPSVTVTTGLRWALRDAGLGLQVPGWT